MNLKIAGIVNDSIVDGEGIRLTIFTQGCPHHCFPVFETAFQKRLEALGVA